MKQSFQDIATRMFNAEDNFCEWVQESIGCNRDDALMVLQLYKKLKWVKLVVSMGRYDLKHGAYAEEDVLRRALAQAKEPKGD